MVSKLTLRRLFPVFLLLTGFALTGCAGLTPAATGAAETQAPTGTTAVTPEPTATELPAAARVNGEPILLSDYQAELARFQAAQADPSATPSAEQRQTVLNSLVDQVLLAQAAEKTEPSIDPTALDARIQALAQQVGGDAALADWQQRNGYTPETFRADLRREMLAALQRDQIAASVPETGEQVRARQILVLDESLANKIHSQLDDGVEFATLAKQYDPVTAGELGWFPQGYLTQPEVDAAAFALQPGEYSAVIHSALGYHIIQVIERDPAHLLSPDARRMMQQKALQDWLEQQHNGSQIEVLLP